MAIAGIAVCHVVFTLVSIYQHEIGLLAYPVMVIAWLGIYRSACWLSFHIGRRHWRRLSHQLYNMWVQLPCYPAFAVSHVNGDMLFKRPLPGTKVCECGEHPADFQVERHSHPQVKPILEGQLGQDHPVAAQIYTLYRRDPTVLLREQVRMMRKGHSHVECDPEPVATSRWWEWWNRRQLGRRPSLTELDELHTVMTAVALFEVGRST